MCDYCFYFFNRRYTENLFVDVQFEEAIDDSLWPNGTPFLPVNWTSSSSWPDCLVLTADKLWNRVNCSSTTLSLCSRIGRSIKRAKMDVTYQMYTEGVACQIYLVHHWSRRWYISYVRYTTDTYRSFCEYFFYHFMFEIHC